LALISHYKLDGNANDSIGGNNGTNSGATWVTGKIGQAASFSISTNCVYVRNFTMGETTSVSVWAYNTTTSGNKMLFSFNSSNGPDLYFTESTICWNTGDGTTNTFMNGSQVAQPSINVWHHYAVVNSPTLGAILYVDGAYYGTALYRNCTQSSQYFTIGNYCSPPNWAYYWTGYIDDVKIYNHALSPKEIKELSKAKILHYKFDQLEEYTTNLWTNHTTPIWVSAYNGNYGFGVGTDLQQVAYNSDTIEKGSAITKVSRITGGTNQVDYVAWDIPCAANTTRTISFWYFGSYGTQITPYNNDGHEAIYYLDSNGNWQGGSTSQPVPVVEKKWQRIVLKIVADATGGTMTWNILHSNASPAVLANTEYWLFTGLQVELKDHATPFTIGTRADVITDSSGYGNSGVININGPAWKTDGKLGKGYVNFSIQNAYQPYCDSTSFRKFPLSISAWVKTSASGTYSGIVCITYAVLFVIGTNGLISFSSYGGGWQTVYSSGHTSLYDNVWHHVAITYTGTAVVIYVDGVNRGSGTINNTTWNWTNGVYVGVDPNNSGTSLIGSMDDVRIYMSTLSASDILELYQTRASIDNQGALTTQSITEMGLSYKPSLVDYSTWVLNKNNSSQLGFNLITGEGSDYITNKKNPVGTDDIIWAVMNNDVTSDGDGGWNGGTFPVDPSKKYRFSIWIRKENIANGNLYFGCLGDTVDMLGTTTAQGNPYFAYGGLPALGEWYLLVAYVWPSSYALTVSDTTTGIYATSGSIASPMGGNSGYGGDFKWRSGITASYLRAYFYYSTDPNAYQYFYRPRVDLCDGTEPTIGDLLACRENPVLLTNTEAQGLVSEYTMNSASGSSLIDRMNRYNATLYNTPSFVPGISGNALQLNGSTQYALANIATPIRAISVWFKHVVDTNGFVGLITGQGGWYLGLANGTGGLSDESIQWSNASTLLMYVRNGETAYLDDKWHHAVVSFGGNNNFWMDGVLQSVTYSTGSSSTDGTITLNSTEIGKYYGYTSYFTGLIGDVRFYNRNLTQTDVNQLFDSKAKLESSGNYIASEFSETGPSQGLVVNYQCDIEKPRITFNYTGTITRDSQNRFWKSSGADAWDAHIYSSEGYTNGCYLSFRVNVPTNASYMIGINTDPPLNASYASLDFCWYMTKTTNNYYVYENGVNPYISGVAMATGDLLAISYWDGIVTYWLNGVAKRSVNAGFGKTFYLDSSFATPLTSGPYQVYDIYFGQYAPDFHVQTFYGNGTFYPPNGVTSVEALIVAGGGGGGMDMGGGGGGGGVIYNANVAVPSASTYPVVIGVGGTGAPAAGTFGQPAGHQYTVSATAGANSIFAGLTATGGGYGGSSVHTYLPNYGNGGSGGSGGGASGYANDSSWDGSGAASPAGQGNRGGNSGGAYYSGGGGGAGAAGADGQNRPNGGDGLVYNSISAFYWGGGGGGSAYSGSLSGGNGGLGGGGGGAVGTGGSGGIGGINNGSAGTAGPNEAWANVPGGNAGANTGGGGGGGSHYNANNKGGDGGSGIVMIKYKKPIIDTVGINHGIPYGGISMVDGPSNKKAFMFNGVDQYILFPKINLGTSNFTYSFWAKHTSITTNNTYFENGLYTDGMLFRQSSSTLLDVYADYAASSWTTTFGFTPTIGVWYHLIAMRENGFFKLIINGSQVGSSVAMSTPNIRPSGSHSIGMSNHSTPQKLIGSIADFRIYNRALDTKEISTLYNLKPSNMYIESEGIVNTSLLIE